MKNKYNWRTFFNDIHLWLGIGSGLVLFVVCLSGTLYTFRTEVEQLLEPNKYNIQYNEGDEALPLVRLIEILEKETTGKVTFIEVPANKTQSYQARVIIDAKDRRGTGYFINPYNGTLLGTSEGPATGFFMFMFKMHRWLLMEQPVGKVIVGTSTIIFIILLLSGMILWFPKKIKNWKQRVTIKLDGGWKRMNHDLHNTLGFYSFILLLIMALTGLCWSFDWYKDGLGNIMGAEVFKGRGEKPLTTSIPEGADKLALEAIIQKSNILLPYPGDVGIVLPTDNESAIVIRKHKEHGFFTLASSDKLQLNQYTGEALEISKFSDKPLNLQIVELIRPLHTGEVFGLFSKILYFITCLFATSFPVTGTIIWINKLKKKSIIKKKQSLNNLQGKTVSKQYV